MTATGNEAVTLSQLKSVVGGSSDGASCFSVDIAMNSTVEVGGFSIKNGKAQKLTVSGIVGNGFLAVCAVSSGGELSYGSGQTFLTVKKLDGSNVSTAKYTCAAYCRGNTQYNGITRIESSGSGTSSVTLSPTDSFQAYAFTTFELFT